jgi:hypothetical protein
MKLNDTTNLLYKCPEEHRFQAAGNERKKERILIERMKERKKERKRERKKERKKERREKERKKERKKNPGKLPGRSTTSLLWLLYTYCYLKHTQKKSTCLEKMTKALRFVPEGYHLPGPKGLK